MAGRHGVPAPDRRSHARSAAGARRRRAQTRDAAQPWAAWLALRGFLALLVLAAASWSVLLLTQSRGGIWPIIALAAGALSLAMIALDVRARRRQRAAWRAQSTAPRAASSTATAVTAASAASAPAPPETSWTEPPMVLAVDAVGGVEDLASVADAQGIAQVDGGSAAASDRPKLAPPPQPSTSMPSTSMPSTPVPDLPRRRSHRK